MPNFCTYKSYSELLYVDVVSRPGMQGVGDKVILHSRVDLYNVATLASHVQVIYGLVLKGCWSGHYCKCVCPATAI